MRIAKIYYIKKIWESPTLTTWASLGTQSLNLILVLPLILNRLSPENITLWYLLSSLLSLQIVFKFGFSPTFVRLFSYASSGVSPSMMCDLVTAVDAESPGDGKMDKSSLAAVCATQRQIFLRLVCAAFLGLGLIGTWTLWRPISLTNTTGEAWMGWAVVLMATLVRIYGSTYESFLIGLNKVALVARWQVLCNLLTSVTLMIVLLVFPNLLALILANQAWLIVNVFRNRWLCRKVSGGSYGDWSSGPRSSQVWKAAWPASWRSGLGHSISEGSKQALGLVYAQFGEPAAVAAFLLAMKLVQSLDLFAMAPFYSALPLFNKLRAEGRLVELNLRSATRMQLALWSFVVAFACLTLFGPTIIYVVRSEVLFPSTNLWMVLGLAYFIHRFGAMHIQLYSTTNRIIWHWANGGMGLLTVVISLALLPVCGELAFALAILSGTVYYAVFSVSFSYRLLTLEPWKFELHASLFPALVFLVFLAVEYMFRMSNTIVFLFS